jgi:ParB-like chromosome segregation protein Spo0J
MRSRLDEPSVIGLMESIKSIGLQDPPTVRFTPESAVLVTGRHRVEACKRLGMELIHCAVFEGDETVARLWEIAENLHPADLTAFEHDEQSMTNMLRSGFG